MVILPNNDKHQHNNIDFGWQEKLLQNQQNIIQSDCTDVLNSQRKKRFPDKFHQIFANKRKLGSLQEYAAHEENHNKSRDGSPLASLQRSISLEEYRGEHQGNIIIDNGAISKK